jgi:hypothetical protein
MSEATANAFETPSVSIPHGKASSPSEPTDIQDHISEIQSILNLAPRNSLYFNTAKLLEVAPQLDEVLTHDVLRLLSGDLRASPAKTQTLCIEIGILYLRAGRHEAANQFVAEVAPKRDLEILFNHVWNHYVTADVRRDEELATKLTGREFSTSTQSDKTRLYDFTHAGSPGSLTTLASSIASAIEKYDVTPSTSTLTSIMLLTLRMLPADLKTLRQHIVRKETPREQLEEWKNKLDSEKRKGKPSLSKINLLPSNAVQYVPTLNSVYQRSPAPLKRPIPIEKSHLIANSALEPIWDLLKPNLSELTPSMLLALAKAFNKATLSLPALQLVPVLEKLEKPFLTEERGSVYTIYENVLETLCNDVEFDEVYRVYKSQFYDKSKKTYIPQIANQRKLVSLLLQGISRSPKATRGEKDELYQLTETMKYITPAALSSYCYSLARTVEVSAKALYEIVEHQSGKNFDRHNLRYLNEIFFGLSVRGSFALAHQVLSEMWIKGSVINAQAIDLFLDRCLASGQPDLVKDILALMRPSQPIKLHGENGKRSITTSKQLPVHLSLSKEQYLPIFTLYARFNRVEDFKKALDEYTTLDGHTIDRTLLRRLLHVCLDQSAVSCIELLISTFKQLGLSLGITEANEILLTFQKARQIEKFNNFFDSMPSLGITPDERSYAAKVHSLRQSFQVDLAIEILEEMQAAGVEATATIFEALIFVLVPISVEKAEWVLQHMHSLNVPPTLRVYQPLLKEYAHQQNEAMFQQHLDFATQSTGLPLNPVFCRTVASCLSTLNKTDLIDEWLIPLMKREGVDVSDYSFVSSVLAAYYHTGKDEAAEKLVLSLENLKDLPKRAVTVQRLFGPALAELAQNSLQRTRRLFKFLRTSCGIPLSHNLYATVVESLSHLPDTSQKEAALAWIESEMHPTEYKAFTKSISARILDSNAV